MRQRLGALVAFTFVVVAPVADRAHADPPQPPSRREVLTLVLAAGRTSLATGEHCDDVLPEPGARATLADWIAYNLSLLEGPSQVAVVCHPATGGRVRYTCDVSFQTGQGTESPWSWGVRATFEKNGARWRMRPGFMCTGSG